MADKMDKSLDDLIAEQRTKSKPRAKGSDHRKTEAARPRGGDSRQGARPDSRRAPARKQDAAGPPPRDPAYYMVGTEADAAVAVVLLRQHDASVQLTYA